ncbi:O-acetyltransferase OatA [Achromobacter veterisilvae]|uniref:O-acetyltransferase OatA n=1 Tax=Achromobacter veterisilvae TaxID=2069367 RepID=A0A446CPR0_9BURK|nr:acyltransferase family protein [Achromobacter veterisilvae]SSW69703.1 O-acetyltransferase OatA [Achromobacter veterisilvae]
MFAYRRELDGLRAIAVLTVLFFHAGFSAFPGGFVGVDIFFVLSGYLIVSLISEEMLGGTFSFRAFYERRIRRLLPPLLPVLLLTGAAGFILLSDKQFANLTESLLASLGLASNWYFLSSVGYFDGPGELTPLLHMWSLSIEEQFYLIFPFFLVMANHLKKQWLLSGCLVLLLISLGFSEALVNANQRDAAFYNSFGRFWELLLGASVALAKLPAPRRAVADVLEFAGSGMVLTAVLVYTPTTPFPGVSAVLPTVGAALIIAASGQGRVISPLLKSRILVGVGLISYALYLWHWPIMVFVKVMNPAAGSKVMGGALGATFLLATTSYFLVEAPVRRKVLFPMRRTVYAAAAAAIATMAVLTTVANGEFFKPLRVVAVDRALSAMYDVRRADAIATIQASGDYYQKNLNLNYNGNSGPYDAKTFADYTCSYDEGNTASRLYDCLVGHAKSHNVLVLGDSIGRDTLWTLRRAYPGQNFLMLHQSGCPPSDWHREGDAVGCFTGSADLLGRVRSVVQIDGVILAFRYRPSDWAEVEAGLDMARKVSPNVILLGVSAVFAQPVGSFLRSLPKGSPVPRSVGKLDPSMVGWDYVAIADQARLMADRHGVAFADTSPFYCKGQECALWKDNSYQMPIYWDNQHLTDFGIDAFSQFLRTQVDMVQFAERVGMQRRP